MARTIALLLSVFMFVTFAHGTDIFVKSKRAEVVKSPKKKRDVKAKVKRHDKLKKLKYRRKWYQVSYKGKKGWIYKGKITKNKPEQDQSLLANGQYNPIAAEQMSAGRGLRGLGDMSLKYSEKNPITAKHKQFMDYHQSFITSDNFKPKLTERGIEPVRISSSQLDDFMREGKLGTYAEVEGEFDEE